MSIFKIKDIDYYFSNFLTDDDLFNLNICNKYYHNLFDENFWKKRFYEKYDIKLENKYINIKNYTWKFYCRMIHELLNFDETSVYLKSKINKNIYYSISKDLPDIFYLLITKNNINLDTTLNYGGSIFSSGMTFKLINTMIYKDSINCFETFFSLEKHNPSFYLDIAIARKSYKIVEYLQKIINSEEYQVMMFPKEPL